MSLWLLRKGRMAMLSKFNNPVLLKELKLRFRAFKSFSGLMFYLAALSIFVIGFLVIATSFSGNGFFSPNQSFYLFIMLSILQMGLVMFITPGLTAGSISGEREKQTLNILLTTTQSSFQIILGKLMSSIAFLGLLLVAGLPFYSLVFLFGGVSPWQLITIFFFYFVTMVAIGSIGIFFSTITKKTIVSMIATYGSMIFLGGFTAFFFYISLIIHQVGSTTAGGMLPFTYFWASINPGALMVTLISDSLASEFMSFVNVKIPVWITYLVVYSLITVLALWLSVRNLRARMNRGK